MSPRSLEPATQALGSLASDINMVTNRSKRDRRSPRRGQRQEPEPSSEFEVLVGSVMKILNDLLVELSSNAVLPKDEYGIAISMAMYDRLYMSLRHCDLITVSTLLFEELHKQFEQLLSGTSCPCSVLVSDEYGIRSSNPKCSGEEILLLLRCSLLIIRFLEFDLTVVLERCHILVAILGKLCHQDSHLPFSTQSLDHGDAITSEVGTSSNIILAILEVFLDEVLVHQDFRKYLVMADSVSLTKEKLFLSHYSLGDVHAVMELVSSHFLLSVYDELTFVRFMQSLSWSKEQDNLNPSLGLDSALSLLGYQVIMSSPRMLQAHLVVLASRCIGIHIPRDFEKLDGLAMNRYVLAFELSVQLYSGIMPILNYFPSMTGSDKESKFCAEAMSFDSCIRSSTCNMLKMQIGRFIDFCNLPSHHGLCSGSKVEFLDNSLAYIKENQTFIDEKFRYEACSVLTCIVENILLGESESFHEDGKSSQQEIYVTSVLKLMSSSLLQIVWFMKREGSLNGRQAKSLICKEYESLLIIISSFSNWDVDKKNLKILFAVEELTTTWHKETKLMFSHFASFLSRCFRKKVDFLWKSCIFMMMSLLNLLVFQEGSLNAFQSLLSRKRGGTYLHSCQGMSLKNYVKKPSSLKIASSFKNVRDRTNCLSYEDNRMTIGEITTVRTPNGTSNGSNMLRTTRIGNYGTFTDEANTCNGEIYIKSLQCSQNDLSNSEDLFDFIECDKRKDYSTWLAKRARYRKWRYQRTSSMKHKFKRMEKIWQHLSADEINLILYAKS